MSKVVFITGTSSGMRNNKIWTKNQRNFWYI